jgi:hypothetical protein
MGVMPAWIFTRNKDIEIEGSFSLAGNLIVDIRKRKNLKPSHQRQLGITHPAKWTAGDNNGENRWKADFETGMPSPRSYFHLIVKTFASQTRPAGRAPLCATRPDSDERI